MSRAERIEKAAREYKRQNERMSINRVEYQAAVEALDAALEAPPDEAPEPSAREQALVRAGYKAASGAACPEKLTTHLVEVVDRALPRTVPTELRSCGCGDASLAAVTRERDDALAKGLADWSAGRDAGLSLNSLAREAWDSEVSRADTAERERDEARSELAAIVEAEQHVRAEMAALAEAVYAFIAAKHAYDEAAYHADESRPGFAWEMADNYAARESMTMDGATAAENALTAVLSDLDAARLAHDERVRAEALELGCMLCGQKFVRPWVDYCPKHRSEEATEMRTHRDANLATARAEGHAAGDAAATERAARVCEARAEEFREAVAKHHASAGPKNDAWLFGQMCAEQACTGDAHRIRASAAKEE